MVPAASTTVLRNIGVDVDQLSGELDTRHLVLEKCGVRGASVDEVLDQCPHLDTLVLSETRNLNLLSAV